jgi:hypothetical protein
LRNVVLKMIASTSLSDKRTILLLFRTLAMSPPLLHPHLHLHLHLHLLHPHPHPLLVERRVERTEVERTGEVNFDGRKFERDE